MMTLTTPPLYDILYNMREKKGLDKLTHDRVLSLLDYDAESGEFRWLKKPHPQAGSITIGVPLRSLNPTTGYYRVTIDRIPDIYLHRLAWFYVYERWPTDQLDHIDGNRLNNALENLREANIQQNTQWGYDRRKAAGHIDKRRKLNTKG